MSQCTTSPCLGTPDDIEKIIDAGYANKILPTQWGAGILMRVCDFIVPMLQAKYDETKGSCAFLNNGRCELHDLGLKPTEGKLSHHSISADNFDMRKSLAWNVAKEWINPHNANKINRLVGKYAAAINSPHADAPEQSAPKLIQTSL